MSEFSIGDLIASFADEETTTGAGEWLEDLKSWLTNDYDSLVHRVRKPGLHASGLGKVCGRRNLVAATFGMRLVPNTAGNYFTYDVGHALHFWWQERYLGPKQELWGDWMCVACLCRECEGTGTNGCKHCRLTGRKVTRGLMPMNCDCGVPWQDAIRYLEIPVENEELGYVGHCDGVLVHKPNRRLFEFKTISPADYDKLNAPKADHVIQAHAYMKPLGLDEALIVYENKGSQCKWRVNMFGQFVAGEPKVRPFVVEWDQGIWDSTVTRILDHRRSMEILDGLGDDRPTREEISKLPRVCGDKKCELAARCPVSRECFSID
jgi:hypothetical protein